MQTRDMNSIQAPPRHSSRRFDIAAARLHQQSHIWTAILCATMLAIGLGLTACASRATSAPTPVVTRMVALFIGTLTIDGDCLRVSDRSEDYAVVFAPELTVTKKDNTIQVSNQATDQNVTLHVGDQVRLAGGEVRRIDHFDTRMQSRVPPGCPAPYWMAHSIELVGTQDSE